MGNEQATPSRGIKNLRLKAIVLFIFMLSAGAFFTWWTAGQAYREMRAGTILTLSISLIIVAGALGFILWQRQEKALYDALHRSNESLQKSEQHLAATLRSIGDGVITCDTDGNVINLNAVAETLTGWRISEAEGRPVAEVFHAIHHETRQEADNLVGRALRENRVIDMAMHTVLIARDGTEFQISDSCAPIHDKADNIIGAVLVFRDISEEYHRRKQTEQHHALAYELLSILNSALALPDMLNSVIASIKNATGFDAAGIRLQTGDDFPYFARNGFSDDFLLTENTVVERGKDGGLCRNIDGKVTLQCTCGLVISGKTDPANPLFTRGGSFWTNNAFALLELPAGQDPRHHPRNRCMHEGYGSLALIPILENQKIVGLLQLNNRKTYSLSHDMISFFELISANIGEMLMRKKAEWALQERYKKLKCLYDLSTLIETPDMSLEEIAKKAITLLPPAWQFPEITEARITTEGHIFQTEHFRETPWMQYQKIMAHGKSIGQLAVCYLEERPVSNEGPFLFEERQLIIAFAERLGRVIERNRAEEQIHLNETRLKSLLNIMQYRTNTTQEFLDYALNEVIKLTQSKIGYIYFYHEDRRQFVLNTWSKDVMKECTITNPQTCYELEKTGVWGEAVRQRKSIILNDFQADHPLKKGYPEGHAPLTRFLTIPVFKEDQIVAVVAVANKTSDYDETDVLQLSLFMDSVWKSVDIKMGDEKLRKSEERFKQLAEVFPETIFEADMKGYLTYANNYGLEHFGFTDEDIARGVNIFDFISPPDRQLALERIQGRMQGTRKGYLEYKALKKDGSAFHALALSAPIIIDGIPVGIRGFILDISERKLAEEALRKSEERYRFITDHTADHIWTTDLSLRFIYSSPAVTKILGYTVDELMKLTIDQFFTSESLETVKTTLLEELSTDQDPGVDPNRTRTLRSENYHKDGHTVWLESSLTFVRSASMQPIGILGVSRDITERKKADEQIQYLATHDLLTDLPSLRLAKDRLTMAMNRARRNKTSMAVMFIDLDGFKAVNDTLGHDAGDYVLQQVAERMLSCVRETDTVARVGGDEFLIIATEVNFPDNAAQIAEKVIQTVSQQIMINGQQAVVGTSIGIALFPEHGEDMDKLIKLADEAMYRVKNAGKNGFCFVNTTTK